ncbi:hypothetical protein PCANC_03692 [Puccinia coronata f. sp. avenae]|nr:hypothetical protein PCANC_03692 [Puccinia coronata f. sp. avenae]
MIINHSNDNHSTGKTDSLLDPILCRSASTRNDKKDNSSNNLSAKNKITSQINQQENSSPYSSAKNKSTSQTDQHIPSSSS